MVKYLLPTLLFCLFACTGVRAQEIELEYLYPTPFYDDFNDLYVAPGGRGWAIGQCGTIIQTTDDGRSWTDRTAELSNVRSPQYVNCAPGTNCQTVYLTANRTLFRSTDGGSSWTETDDVTIEHMAFLDNDIVYGYRNRAARFDRSADNGATWSPLEFPEIPTDEVFFPSATEITFFGEESFYRSTDAGQTFGIVSNIPGVATLTHRDEDGTYYVVDRNRAFYVSTDNGQTWDKQTDQAYQYTVYHDLWKGTGDSLHILHFLGIRSSSVDGGATWFRSGIDGNSYGASKRAEGRAMGAGAGMLLTLADGDWNNREYLFGDFRPEFTRFDFVDADLGYAIANDGHVFKTENAGLDWAYLGTGGGQQAYDIRAITADIVVTSTEAAGLMISRDGGRNFRNYRLPNNFEPGPFHALEVLPDSTILLNTREDFFRLDPDGTILAIGVAPDLGGVRYNRMTFFSTDVGILYNRAQDPIYRTADGGLTWTELPALEPTSRNQRWAYAYFPDADNGYLGVGSLHYRTADGGQTWAREEDVPSGNSMFADAEGTRYLMGNQQLYRYTSEITGWDELARLPCGVSTYAKFRPGRNQVIGIQTGSVHRFNIDFINPVFRTPAAAPLNAFPNPTNGRVTVELPTTQHLGGQLRVLTVTGQTVRKQVIGAASTVHLDLSDQPAGIYFLELTVAGQRRVSRLVVR